jgi:diacylglycerol kinase (ATP)
VVAHHEFSDARILALLSPQALTCFETFRSALPEIFPQIDLVAPRNLSHLHELVRQSSEDYPLVLAVGGDGTLFQALQQLDIERQTLGIVPSGTGNDFATAIGFPKALAGRLQHLAQTSATPTDLAFANGQRYLNSAGLGIDTETLLLRERSGAWMKKQYNLLFLRVLRRMKPIQTNVQWTDRTGQKCTEQAGFFWLLAMNSSLIGGGTQIAPEARIDDGLLDMVLIRAIPKLELLRRMPDAIGGRHLAMPLTLFSQTRHVHFEFDTPVPYLALDGELVKCDTSSIDFTAQARALRFLR